MLVALTSSTSCLEPTASELKPINMDSGLASDVATVAHRCRKAVLVVVEVVFKLTVRARSRVRTRSENTHNRSLDESPQFASAVIPTSPETVKQRTPVVRLTEPEPKRSGCLFQHHNLTGPHTIRLIQLLPGGLDDPLRCKIFHTSLNENPEYEAVSYVWGQRTTTSDSPILTVEPGRGHIRVTDNCNRVLRLLRDYIRKRTLWIDAICINQDSDATEERNHQVGLMGKIYKQAACVLIYPRGPKNDYDFSFTGLGKSLQVRSDNWEVLHVLRMEWFRRTWVLQEAYLARKATIILDAGSQRINIPLDKFIAESRRGLLYLSLKDSYWPAILDIRQGLLSHATSSEESCHSRLLDLLIATRDLDATDSRDKIFALVGIAFQGRNSRYMIDYSQTTAQVYVNCALTMLRQTSDLQLLSACNGSPLLGHCDDRDYWETKALLPTWVPDWRRRVYSSTIWDHSRKAANAVYGGYFRRALKQPAPTIHNLRLRVRACIIGTVHRVGSVLLGSPHVSQVADFFGEELKTAMLPKLPYIRSSNSLEDCAPFHLFTGEAQGTKWLEDLDSLLYGRKAFKTDNGYYGLAPYQTSDGDLLCRLSGCITPVLLRRVPDFVPNPGNWYMLIGECYVHGLMDYVKLSFDHMDDYEII